MSRAEMTDRFVLALDLDGTCADFYGRMREIAAEWTDIKLEDLPKDANWELEQWGIGQANYRRFHRFAVTERALFESMAPIKGAPQAIRRLALEGIRVRVVTHRLIIPHFHEIAVAQTVRWLDHHGIPYWDLCFLRHKGAVGADLYVEDSPENIAALIGADKDVVVLSNFTNRHLDTEAGMRAEDWAQTEQIIRRKYYGWLDVHGLDRPVAPGSAPHWAVGADHL
jgi:5'(3')-deoxyribonucleotidase